MITQSILDRCIACDKILDEDDLVYSDEGGGSIHASCCGPEPESYVNANGDPIKAGEPIPKPWRYGDLL